MTRTPRERIRILVADDDPIVLHFTARILNRLGYEVMTVPDGVQALQVFEREPRFQLVISDAMMPGLPGPQLLRTISHLSPSTATLLISGSQEILAGADTPALAKPFRAEALAAKVNGLLNPGRLKVSPEPVRQDI